ncbi:MAG: NAD(P)-binding domain-containing protein [Hymenobacter sp.]
MVETDKGEIATRAVVVATGFFDVPNRMNIPGEDLPHVNHYYKEPYAHADRDVVVVGAKNSSAKAALAAHPCRGPRDARGARPRGVGNASSTGFGPTCSIALRKAASRRISTPLLMPFTPAHGGSNSRPTARAACPPTTCTPSPATSPTTACWTDAAGPDPLNESDTALPPIFDPETHETARPGVYVAGTVCGGLATSRWFIENGRHHAQLIARALAGTLAAQGQPAAALTA